MNLLPLLFTQNKSFIAILAYNLNLIKSILFTRDNFDLKKVKSAGRALHNARDKLPEDRKNELIQVHFMSMLQFKFYPYICFYLTFFLTKGWNRDNIMKTPIICIISVNKKPNLFVHFPMEYLKI